MKINRIEPDIQCTLRGETATAYVTHDMSICHEYYRRKCDSEFYDRVDKEVNGARMSSYKYLYVILVEDVDILFSPEEITEVVLNLSFIPRLFELDIPDQYIEERIEL